MPAKMLTFFIMEQTKFENEAIMRLKNKAFTIVELMVVIMMIGILAAITAPMMRARVNRSKWTEACTSAGAIRDAVRNYAAETNVTTAKGLAGSNLGNSATQELLGFLTNGLDGTYFSPGDYSIISVNDNGYAAIQVTSGSKAMSPTGTYILQEDGKWVMQ